MSTIDPARFHAASLSDVGHTRDTNQDACGEFRSASGERLFVVADGMGGHRGGATASRIAVDTIGEVFERGGEEAGPLLRSAFQQANARIHERAQADFECAGMGTTGVALLLATQGPAWVAHVGDSRASRLRDGQLEALTEDHSVVAELQRRGLVTEEEAAVHPRRNEILRSLGTEPSVEVDIRPVELQPGDRVLLYSDGLCGVVRDHEIEGVLAQARGEAAVRALVDLSNARGGPDNVTVQCVEVPGSGDELLETELDTRELLLGSVRRQRNRQLRGLSLALLVVVLLLAAASGVWWLASERAPTGRSVSSSALPTPEGAPPAAADGERTSLP